MSIGEAIAIGFAAASTVTLLITFYLIRRLYLRKMAEAARALGIGRQMAAALERDGQLPGALGLGQPVAISPEALEVFLECQRQGSK